MQNFFAYIRVSTVRQGERGVSLQEQKEAITRYSQRYSLLIVAWFEERETAAHGGRPVFNQMLKGLRSGKAKGVIIHKIDRSARNLKDWADLGELIDQGVEVHFANESLDLHSRGGRLSADIQAVVAADYIRNLREEVRKGFYGRLKQGLYPLPAPLGYVNKGGGEPKEPHPIAAPLVRKTFELYGSAQYTLDELVEEMYRLGLRKQNGGKVSRTTLDDLLRNPFYMGLIRLKRSKEIFSGIHRPLISKSLFDRVQNVLSGKASKGPQVHHFLFRRMLNCKFCGYALTGEKQKGHIYYRCQTKACPTICIREEQVEEQVLGYFSRLQLSDTEMQYFTQKVVELKRDWDNEQKNIEKALQLRRHQIQERLDRLTDAYLDQAIDKEIFERKKTSLLMEQKEIEENLESIQPGKQSVVDRLFEFLELVKTSYYQYKIGSVEEKRDLLKNLTSNRMIEGKKLDISFVFPFETLANYQKKMTGGPVRARPRTLDYVFSKIQQCFLKTL